MNIQNTYLACFLDICVCVCVVTKSDEEPDNTNKKHKIFVLHSILNMHAFEFSVQSKIKMRTQLLSTIQERKQP